MDLIIYIYLMLKITEKKTYTSYYSILKYINKKIYYE